MRAGIIIYNPLSDKILLIHRWKKGEEYLVIPGGQIEQGENPLAAARREIREELGLDFHQNELKAAFSFQNEGEQEHYFYTVLTDSTAPVIQGEEAERSSQDNIYQPEWVDLKTLYQQPLRPAQLKSLLLEFLAQESLKN